jgi:threonine dehydratase
LSEQFKPEASPDELAERMWRVGLGDFRAAATRIASDAIRTPLLTSIHPSRSVCLKPENLQPLGSFKIRAGASVLATLDPGITKVATASAGNFAQGLARAAQRRGLQLTVHAPDSAARTKLEAVRKLGAEVVEHPFADWWRILSTRQTGADDGTFVHPVAEVGVMLGNGTIGLELAEDWPELDTVVVPYGGGGLVSGIALALLALGQKVRVVACEIETAAALSAAFTAGEPVRIERQPSFVDGIGSSFVLPEMWPLVRRLVDDVVVVSLQEAEAAVTALALEHHLVAEGAGAVAYAAAHSDRCGGRHVAAIISGGNIDLGTLGAILARH